MFTQELDMFNDINLVYMLGEYHSLEVALKSKINIKLCTGIPPGEEYCLVSIDDLTNEILGIVVLSKEESYVKHYKVQNEKLIYKGYIGPRTLHDGFSTGYYIMRGNINSFSASIIKESFSGCGRHWWVKCICN
jgi:hypothetical protein